MVQPSGHVGHLRLRVDPSLSSLSSRYRRPVASFDDGAIVFQMGRARLAARGTTLKSTVLAQSEAQSIVLSVGTARRYFSAWAATSARRAGPRHDPI
jgi:hypothetical protein